MERKKVWGVVATVSFAVLILVGSIIPANMGHTMPSFYFPGMDKLVHFMMYGILAGLVMNLYTILTAPRLIPVLVLMLSTWGYSVLLELVQLYLVSSRSGDIKDALANLLGVMLGTVLVLGFKRIRS